MIAFVRLTPRQLQIVILVGRDQLTYEQVGAQLGIKSETARQYAERIRDQLGSAHPPRRALAEHYLRHREQFETAGFAA